MLNAAIFGLGWWGRHMVRRMADSDKLRIVRAVDPSEEAVSFAAEHGVPLSSAADDALSDPAIDAVILCTPHSMHTAQVEAVAAAGKHCFCEKPLALTRADAERSVAACRAAGVKLGIGHERRYEPAMQEVARLIKNGELGTIMHIESNFSHDKLANVAPTDWRASPKDAPAAGMTAMGIHLTDAYLNLLGPVSTVHALTAKRALDFETGDVVSVTLQFESGATGFISAVLKTPLFLRLTVFGSEAWVDVRNHTHPDTMGPVTLTLQRTDQEPVVRTYEWTDTVRANLEAFADAAMGNGSYPFTDEEKVGNIAVLEAVTQSAASGQPVTIGAHRQAA
ncbi:MAG: Gfo/Idh/MocA family oxidoreductase [Pseudomonadota bacterium]